jgi:glycosyltransferase involved in cell wall biosynthesis
MPKFSIITTTYKHEAFIAQAIESILRQSFTDWELLIWDDNSPDKTFEIAQSYALKDSRIRVWKNTTNLGIVGNMNQLIGHISPWVDYITFLEWDDMYTIDNLLLKFRVFEEYPDVEFVYSHFSMIDTHSDDIKRASIQRQVAWKKKYSLQEFLSRGNPIQSFGVVAMRQSQLGKVLPISTPHGETVGMYWPLDYWLWIHIIPDQCIYYIDQPIFRYRIHANNFVKNIAIMNSQFQEIYESLMATYPKNSEILKICHFFIENNSMMTAFFVHNTKNVWNHWLKSFVYNTKIFLLTRVAVLCASLFPWVFIDWLYKKYRS